MLSLALFHEEVLSGINTQDATVSPQQIVLTGDKVVKTLRDHYFSEVIR